MNLRAIANSATRGINPNIAATLKRSIGAAIAADGSRTPLFTTEAITVQAQALDGGDLKQIDGLNLNGVHATFFITGALKATERVSSRGGDLVVIASGKFAGTWLVVQVLESWPDWCKAVVTLQDGA